MLSWSQREINPTSTDPRPFTTEKPNHDQDYPDPVDNVTKMLEQFKVPGMDMPALIELERKEIDALFECQQGCPRSDTRADAQAD